MFSVFNTNLQTDMGKTIVRRHLASTDAQSVWKELSEHMRTSSKGASEKRRLTQYVTIQHLPNPIGPQPVISVPISSSRPTAYSPSAHELMSFKKGIKREITAYPF